MDFRIDPVDERGVFDHDFYTSENYAAEVNILKKYLMLEGFDTMEGEFPITIRDRAWLVVPTNKPKRKKK
jgi:hypothetical protein